MQRKRPISSPRNSFGFSDTELAAAQRTEKEANGARSPPSTASEGGSSSSPLSAEPPPRTKRKLSHLNLPSLVIEDDAVAVSEVFPEKLYIGGEASIGSLERLQITHVVRLGRHELGDNVVLRTYGALLSKEESGSLAEKLMHVITSDDWDASIDGEKMVEFINKALSSGGRVLIHCREGISRSSAAALLYLVARKRHVGAHFEDEEDEAAPLWRQPYPLAAALCFLKERRPSILPNVAIMGKVVALEQFVHHRVTVDCSAYVSDPRRFMREAVPAKSDLQPSWEGNMLTFGVKPAPSG